MAGHQASGIRVGLKALSMIDKQFERDLHQVKSQIQNCVSIYSQELERRHRRLRSDTMALAPDADVIHGYLHPKPERDFASAAIEALMQTEALQTIVLPGTREEIEIIYRAELAASRQPLYHPRTNPASAVSTEGRREVLDNLKYDLAVLSDRLSTARAAVDRLSRFLSSRCFASNIWSDVDPALFDPAEEDIEEIFGELTKFRRHPRGLQVSLVDSRNVASILAASRNGLHIPFVTNTHALLDRVGRTIKARPAETGLLIGPFTAVTIVCLARAESGDISRLLHSASALLEIMDRTGDQDDDLFSEFNEYMQATYRLAEVGALLNRTWSPPDIRLPHELDLRQTASFALEQVQILTAKIAEISRRFGLRPSSAGDSRDAAEEFAKSTALNVELLKDIQSGDQKVIIQKLIILHEGARMSEYNINQTGSNLTAIVDSFKTTQLIGGGFPDEVEQHMKILLESLLASKITEEEKKDAVESAIKVAEDVKKEGRLAGTAKILWNGLRETIKSVPAALAAWDAIQKHWH
jgi:hypothetical protein